MVHLLNSLLKLLSLAHVENLFVSTIFQQLTLLRHVT